MIDSADDVVTDALRDADPNWYDADQQSWNPVDVRPDDSPTAPWLGSLFEGGAWIIGIVILLALALVLAVAVIAIVRSASRREPTGNDEPEPRVDVDVAELPFALDDGEDDPERAYAQARKSGDHRRAVLYAYAHVLLRLHDARWLRLAPAKTSRTLGRELARHSAFPEPRLDAFRALARLFEETYFADRRIGVAEGNACDEQYHAVIDGLQPRETVVT